MFNFFLTLLFNNKIKIVKFSFCLLKEMKGTPLI